MTEPKRFRYSEIFHSFQGEGHFTGRSTAWLRLFACNLTCAGFGQDDPTDPCSYVEPYKHFDVSSITRVEDLPVWEFGCDSSYTWSARFKHLMHNETAATICDGIQHILKHTSNPEGLFLHPITKQWHHMAFTGGEPILKRNQLAIEEVLVEFLQRGNYPHHITIETNGTQELQPSFVDTINKSILTATDLFGVQPEWFWSVSPKLWSTSGELSKRAINPEAVAGYRDIVGCEGQLKYVVNGTDQSWNEVVEHTAAFRSFGVDWPVYIMPVGATKESQEEKRIADIAMEAMKLGYHFSGRLHCATFGNLVGT